MINSTGPASDAGTSTDRDTTLISDEEVQRKLDDGDSDKIDTVLEELGVTKTDAGADQTEKSDTEGSNSSSKNLDEEDK